MRSLSAAHVRDALDFPRLIDALRTMFAQGCEVPLRHTHLIGDQGTSLLMPAWRIGKRFGVKIVNIFPNNIKINKPGLHSTYTLFDASTGEPLALMDGNEITSRRTVAASALAASFLARPDSKTLLVVGAGRVASLSAYSMRVVLKQLSKVEVWNVFPKEAEALVAQLRRDGFDAHVSSDLAQSCREADVVSCATLSTSPLIKAQWLRPGTHVDLIGSFTPAMTEVEPECLRVARVYVDTIEAVQKSGDILNAIKEAKFNASKDLQGTLEDLCRGTKPGRTNAKDITLFKSVGTALEDLAAAELAFDSRL